MYAFVRFWRFSPKVYVQGLQGWWRGVQFLCLLVVSARRRTGLLVCAVWACCWLLVDEELYGTAFAMKGFGLLFGLAGYVALAELLTVWGTGI